MHHPTRRQFLAAATVAPIAAGAAERYRLGCQTLPYRALPLERALQGIRKAGYRYLHPFHSHAGRTVFGPSLTAAERAELQRRFRDAGLEPFLSFIGLTVNIRKAEGLDAYLKELDFYREFGIRTVVGVGPSYYTRFPAVPKRARDWDVEASDYYAALEHAVKYAESIGVTITLKPHTGITANAKACLEVVKRIPSERLKICWDAGNVSFYEGIHPDPDLPDLAPHVKSVCIKDHLGLRGDANFPVPGQGQIDHPLMFQTLFAAGFAGPLSVERIDGKEDASKMPAELIDQRNAEARQFLEPLLEKAVAS